jgi:hypothetical protein
VGWPERDGGAARFLRCPDGRATVAAPGPPASVERSASHRSAGTHKIATPARPPGPAHALARASRAGRGESGVSFLPRGQGRGGPAHGRSRSRDSPVQAGPGLKSTVGVWYNRKVHAGQQSGVDSVCSAACLSPNRDLPAVVAISPEQGTVNGTAPLQHTRDLLMARVLELFFMPIDYPVAR